MIEILFTSKTLSQFLIAIIFGTMFFPIQLALAIDLKGNTCAFLYIRDQYKHQYPVAASRDNSNFQQAIWQLRDQGELELAQQLENEVISLLSLRAEAFQSMSEGASAGWYFSFPLQTVGVAKKAGRHWSSNVEAEVAAFKVDRLFGFDLTPVTIPSQVELGYVSIQLFYKHATPARFSKIKALPTEIEKLKIFDYLIDNFDRRDVNFLITETGRVVAIDHGVSFHNARAIQYSPYAPKLDELDLTFFQTPTGQKIYHNLKNISDQKITESLKPYLNDRTLSQFITRKNKLLSILTP